MPAMTYPERSAAQPRAVEGSRDARAARVRDRLFTASLLFLAGCAANAKETAPPPALTTVQTTTLGTATTTTRVTATGTLGAKEEVSLSFKIGGVIQSITVNPGDRVRAGQLLARLSQAEIGNEVAKARLGRDKAERDLARVKTLHADATLEQLQDATTAFDVAQANVRIAEFNQRYAAITAPADGIILERLVERNQLVTPGATIVKLRTMRDGLVLRVGLSDRDASRVRVGDAATVTFDAMSGRVFTGVVSQVGLGAAARTGTFDVEIALRNTPAGVTLPSGLIGKAEITPRVADSGTVRQTIPIEALVEATGDTATIFIVAPGDVAKRQTVVVTALEGEQVVLRDALPDGTQIITAGAAFVVDGSKVRIDTARSAAPDRAPTTRVGGARP
jgi:membrane fusion protein, multidrug efflux system